MSEPRSRWYGFRLVDVAILTVVLGITVAVLIPSVVRVTDRDMASMQSINNIKQMGMAMHGIASRNHGLLPPSVGTFPGSKDPNATIFFHMLSDIEQDNVYKEFSLTPTNAPKSIKTFVAPLDATNDGVHHLTSYASNAVVFGFNRGDRTIRYPDSFQSKGTSNTILFMERYAIVGAAGTRHTWYGIGDRENYLYSPETQPDEINLPEFGVAPTEARNDSPHAFSRGLIRVGVADGSCRTLNADVARTFSYANGRTATIWAWACSLDGPLGKSPTPTGW